MRISETQEKIKKFVEERNWNESHNPKNLSMSIAIESAELMEIFQWKTLEESKNIGNTEEFEHFKEELADVLIYCISMANNLDLDIVEIIEEKMIKNAKKYPVER